MSDSFIDSLIPKEELKQLTQKDIKILRDNILNKQNNICPICNKEIKEGKAVLEHSHKKKVGGSGLIRGVCCTNCNIMIGKVENNCKRYNISLEELPNVLINISKWLSKEHLPFIHPSEKPKEPILTKSSYNELKKLVSEKDLKKLPVYKVKKQKLTKVLKELFEKYNLEPQFYK